jgi:hypothetical protein
MIMYNKTGKKMAYKSIVKNAVISTCSSSPTECSSLPSSPQFSRNQPKSRKKSVAFSVIFPD